MGLEDAEVVRLLRLDEMTGLFNRAYFLERVKDDMLRSERYGWPLSVLLLSIERLDALAAAQGRLAADNALATVASMIRKFARNTDVPARYDQTRFAILLPGTGEEGAASIAERLRHRVATHLFTTGDGRTFQVPCGVGHAEYAPTFRETGEFLDAAEAKLAAGSGPGSSG